MREHVIRLLRRSGLLSHAQRIHNRLQTPLDVVVEWPGAAAVIAAWRRLRPPPVGVPRCDPDPPCAPFPPGRYVFLVDVIDHGGRTASVLSKVRRFRAEGLDCLIVTTREDRDVDELTRQLVDRRALPEGAPIRRLEDCTGNSFHERLDSIVGDTTTFISVEWRGDDRQLLTYTNPRARVEFVYHSTHLKPPAGNPRHVLAAYRPTIRSHAPIVFPTARQRADVEALVGRQDTFRVIPPTVPEVVAAPDIDREPNLLVVLARLERVKRLEHAVLAFQRVQALVPDARLELHGIGTQRARIQRLVDRLGLGTSVTLPGFATDPSVVYRRAALSLLVSRSEGFGLVLLESLRHGCPVIAYDVPYGPADIIAHGVNGLLVESGNIRALSDAIVRVLTDDALRQCLVAGAPATLERFSSERFMARWSDLFNRRLAEKGAAAVVEA